MKLNVRTEGVQITEGLLEHVDRKLRFALGRFGDHVRDVRVRLKDVNGPRGGEDHRGDSGSARGGSEPNRGGWGSCSAPPGRSSPPTSTAAALPLSAVEEHGTRIGLAWGGEEGP